MPRVSGRKKVTTTARKELMAKVRVMLRWAFSKSYWVKGIKTNETRGAKLIKTVVKGLI